MGGWRLLCACAVLYFVFFSCQAGSVTASGGAWAGRVVVRLLFSGPRDERVYMCQCQILLARNGGRTGPEAIGFEMVHRDLCLPLTSPPGVDCEDIYREKNNIVALHYAGPTTPARPESDLRFQREHTGDAFL